MKVTCEQDDDDALVRLVRPRDCRDYSLVFERFRQETIKTRAAVSVWDWRWLRVLLKLTAALCRYQVEARGAAAGLPCGCHNAKARGCRARPSRQHRLIQRRARI